MTKDELIEEAKRLITFATDRMKEKGHIPYLFILFGNEISDIYDIDGQLMNDPDRKKVLAITLRQRVVEKKAEATLFLSDTYIGKNKTTDPVKLQLINAIIRHLDLNVGEAAKMGLVEKSEAILVYGALPNGEWAQLLQLYMRDPANPKAIMLDGDPNIFSGDGHNTPEGRMSEWFKAPSAKELQFVADNEVIGMVKQEEYTAAK